MNCSSLLSPKQTVRRGVPRTTATGLVVIDRKSHTRLHVRSFQVSYADTFTVRFRAWEATKGMRLRVCCDDFCPFSTDIGKSRRKWRQLRVTCPAETRQLAFECEMIVGKRKGVCAIDDVFVEADECPAI